MTSNPAQNDAGPSNPAPNDAGPSNPAPNDAGPSNPAPNDAGTSNPAPNNVGTSPFAQHGHLSQRTLETYEDFRRQPENTEAKFRFYYAYLVDVVPWGITVHRLPPSPQPIPRDQIQLQTPSGKIFMLGLLAMEIGFDMKEPTLAAAAEARRKWFVGHYLPDDDKWRCFVGIGAAFINFFNGQGHGNLDEDEWFIMMLYPHKVATYLQRKYDSLPPASRF